MDPNEPETQPNPASKDTVDEPKHADGYAADPVKEQKHFSHLIPKQKKHTGRNIIITLLVLLILASIGFAVYYFLIREKPATQAPVTSSEETSQQTHTTISTTTKTYSSTNQGVSFDYPDDWTVNDPETGALTATSPTMTLKSAGGKDVNGQVVFSVAKASDSKYAEFEAGNATAVIDSKKITYAKPSQSQRGETYISFLRYASSIDSGGIDAVYITGDSGYTVGQAIPKVDVTKVDPLVTITFVDSEGKAIAIQKEAWQNPAFGEPLEKMLMSLNIR